VPLGLATIPQITEVWLDNNNFLGPIPTLKATNFTFSGNGFCTNKSGFLRCHRCGDGSAG
jgi:hypothetical protein